MWQRVQTLYFGIATALIATLIFGTMAVVLGPDGQSESIAYFEHLPFAILLIIACLCTLVATVSFKHRGIQIRLAAASAVIMLALQGWFAFLYFSMADNIVFKWTVILPIIVVILEIMAIRGVYADELLVRSASRLRSAKRKSNNKK